MPAGYDYGLLLQWPTILTLVMLPFLVIVYVRLDKREEQSALDQFGEQYRIDVNTMPGFIPRFKVDGSKTFEM